MTHVLVHDIPLANRLLQVGPLAWAEEVLALAKLRDALHGAMGGPERVCEAMHLIVEWGDGETRIVARGLVSLLGVRWAADAVDCTYERMVQLALRGGLDVPAVLAVSDKLRGSPQVNVSRLSKAMDVPYSTVRHLAELMGVERHR